MKRNDHTPNPAGGSNRKPERREPHFAKVTADDLRALDSGAIILVDCGGLRLKFAQTYGSGNQAWMIRPGSTVGATALANMPVDLMADLTNAATR